ncbi:MAG: DEAD/DEAH box helicase family protein [Chloroflexi bacterium]|nr:DEAD/DEAH box helicase family protein [Chloroflexota bacterium]
MTTDTSFQRGDHVRSAKFGIGRVEVDTGLTIIVRFQHGIEECQKPSLNRVFTPLQTLELDQWHAPVEVITRIQAEAIQSVNDTWGVFSRSRIALLPHQLWVCRRVLEDWPMRWLVADDVGLGKTIEAGLILWPLLSRGTVKRLLILCRAYLVEQWQYRLRTMFDIRMARYAAASDTEKGDFWNTHNQVVASLETIRLDRGGRHDRLFESEPWDLLIVDEAHHLNADEQSGPTLGYEVVERLENGKRVKSILFFTGTPHRGKNYGFISLLRLLRPDIFDVHQSMTEQLPSLRNVMIRNNKQNVTDLKGNRLFEPPLVSSETYDYSPAEAHFYDLLTEFILKGQAYATSLDSANRRMVILILITMQKLASSSVAAVRRALKGRLSRISATRSDLEKLQTKLNEMRQSGFIARYQDLETAGDTDAISKLEEQILALTAAVQLMQDEESYLRELILAAEAVREETKIGKILDIIEDRFAGREVLLFTEYKATQSLIMTTLIRRFGAGCVGFINGDGIAEDVIDLSGASVTIRQTREEASAKFNSGGYRFLVSTEAGGEGIDLQERCHCLIHVDLPWNPMRLHQRVGRLNRYGQQARVEVISLHNPHTVESLIWEKLNAKISNIQIALSQVMDEPEDLLQLVLGMASPTLFLEVFAEASSIPRQRLSDWFDQKTARFGGQDVIETVKNLVGNCAKFDFQQVSPHLPAVDLPDLAPFLRTMLTLNGRKFREDGEGLTFKTPESWLNEPGVRTLYERVIFDRENRSSDAAQRVIGVGHKIMDQAVDQAKVFPVCAATMPDGALERPLLVFRVSDRVTGESGVIRSMILGMELGEAGQRSLALLRDWELLQRLNGLIGARGIRRAKTSMRPDNTAAVATAIEETQREVESRLGDLDLPFKVPMVENLAVIWPTKGGPREGSATSDADEDEID